MSDYEIPFHIQENIMKRLPVKSLVQFRSVSKSWKSLIDSSEFIASHSLRRRTHPQHMLVTYVSQGDKYYICFLDDDTYPQQRFVPTFPLSPEHIFHIGSSHGLFGLYYSLDHNFTTKSVILWNPFIRKSIVVPVPNKSYVGFGVCPVTSDPKIVSVTQSWDEPRTETSYHCEVMVYTLSSGKWKTVSDNLPTKPLEVSRSTIVTNRFIYWRADSWTGNSWSDNMMISFDATNEKFEMIELPDSLAHHDPKYMYVSMVRDSLAIIQSTRENIKTVWMMEHGVERMFTKLFIIETPHVIAGFRKSGVPILEVTDYYDPMGDYKLVAYEPHSEHNNIPEIPGPLYALYVYSYMETLLLLGRPDETGRRHMCGPKTPWTCKFSGRLDPTQPKKPSFLPSPPTIDASFSHPHVSGNDAALSNVSGNVATSLRLPTD
ncbi:hypothetical protein LXL04_000759 [Taraxacum kok-saghyz]